MWNVPILPSGVSHCRAHDRGCRSQQCSAANHGLPRVQQPAQQCAAPKAWTQALTGDWTPVEFPLSFLEKKEELKMSMSILIEYSYVLAV